MADTTNTLRQVQIHHLVTLKHTETNHLLWKAQFKQILKRCDLTGFIDGTKQKPARTLPNSDDINPYFTAYESQDSLIVGWLNSTLIPEVLCNVARIETANEIWDKLESEYAPKMFAHQMSLKKQLHSLSKGNKSLKTYLNDAKSLFHQLAESGCTKSADEKKQAISNGLNQSYDPIVTSLSTVEGMELETFYSHLQIFDMRLEQQLSLLQTPVANVAVSNSESSSKPDPRRFNNQNKGSYHPNNNQPYHRNQQSQRSTQFEQPCQICKKKGHQGD